MFNIMDPIKCSAGKKKENPGGTDAHLSLKICLHVNQSSLKKNDGAPRRYVVIWNNSKKQTKKNPTSCSTSG